MANPKGKKKFLLWIYPSTQELVKNNSRKDHCKSQSEFIERAIQYYEANATGELTTLYSNTAKWLRQLLAVGMNAVAKAVKESEERANEKTPEIQEGEQT